MSIINTWLSTYDRPTDALNAINEDIGAKYNTGNFTQWKQEDKGLSPRAYNYMLMRVLNSIDGDLSYDSLRAPDPRNPIEEKKA